MIKAAIILFAVLLILAGFIFLAVALWIWLSAEFGDQMAAIYLGTTLVGAGLVIFALRGVLTGKGGRKKQKKPMEGGSLLAAFLHGFEVATVSRSSDNR